jgi:hypothetical protein
MKLANQLLDKPRAKQQIETLAISRSSPAWIASALSKLGYETSIKSLEMYLRYYWDLELLDSTEVKVLLRMRTRDDAVRGPEGARWFAEEYNAMKYDPRVLAADMPIDSIGRMMSIMAMGYMPSKAEFSRIMYAGRNMAAVQFMAATMRHWSEGSRDFSLAAKNANELLESVGSPEEDLHTQLNSAMLLTDGETPPMLDDLSSGNHTVDVLPINERVENIEELEDDE